MISETETRINTKLESTYLKVNGFTYFPNFHQLLSITLLLLKLTNYTLLLLPGSNYDDVSIFISTMFYCSNASLVAFALICYSIDPVDSSILSIEKIAL